MELKVAHFPRINKEACLYCFDDCVATIGNTAHFDYELMYLTLFDFNFIYGREESVRVGDNARLNFPNRYENMLKYHGVRITDIDVKEDSEKALELIKSSLATEMPVLVYVDPFWCPWDLQYQKIHERGSGHTLIVTDVTEDGIYMADPYFDRYDMLMPYSNFAEGILTVSNIVAEKKVQMSDEELYQGLSESLLDVKKKGTVGDFIQLYKNFYACEDIHNEVRGYNFYLYSPVFVHFMLINQGICYYAAALQKLASYLEVKDENLQRLGEELWEVGHKWSNFRYEMKVNFFSERKTQRKRDALNEKMRKAVYKIEEIFDELFERYLVEAE